MKIAAQFIIICREAFLEAGTNNLNLIRIFSQINADRFPYVLPNFALVVNFDTDSAGTHTLHTELRDPNGKQIASTELPVTTAGGNWQVIANFEQMQFATPGAYTFVLTLDNAPLGSRTVEVRAVATPVGQKTNLA